MNTASRLAPVPPLVGQRDDEAERVRERRTSATSPCRRAGSGSPTTAASWRRSRRRCRAWMRASSGSRANARTASALAIESATWPASTFDAASRTSTSRRRRRISGTPSPSVAASMPSSTTISHGEYVHSTTADEAERQQRRRDLERQHVEHVLEAPRVAERALGERAGVVVRGRTTGPWPAARPSPRCRAPPCRGSRRGR